MNDTKEVLVFVVKNMESLASYSTGTSTYENLLRQSACFTMSVVNGLNFIECKLEALVPELTYEQTSKHDGPSFQTVISSAEHLPNSYKVTESK